MDDNKLEIERKFLIAYPSEELLHGCESSEIVQTYLEAAEKGVSERVRKRGSAGSFTYTHTLKKHISDITRFEEEREISCEEYEKLLERADKTRRTIYKTRYILQFEGQSFEIDVFPFWSDRAFLELELENERQEIAFPDGIRIIRELTHDRRYTNASLARQIPQDDI